MRVCPVCLQTIQPSMRGNIAAHRDTTGRDMCPATGHPIHITEKRGK